LMGMRRTMNEIDKVIATQQLHAQLSDYWHDVDTNWGRNAGDYYTDDAVFETNRTSYHGKAKIREFYQWRIDRGPRVAIHAFTNFRVVFHDDSHATSTWYLLLFAQDGKPIMPTAPPIQIALMSITFFSEVVPRRDIAERVLVPLRATVERTEETLAFMQRAQVPPCPSMLG
jgi:hypothetical protein